MGSLHDKQKYLGKVVSSEVGPFFLNLPVNIEGDNKMKGNSPFGVAVKLTNETKFQVLVAEGETGPKLSTILCQKTRKAVKLSEYRENKELEVKIVEGGKIPHYQKILQKSIYIFSLVEIMQTVNLTNF